jgi:malate permease and related proteins
MGRRRGKQSVNLVLTVAEIVAPVGVLAMVGFLWVRAGFEYRLEFVTRLSMTLAVPCLIFTALVDTPLDPAALTEIALAAGLAYGALTLAFWAAVALLGLDRRTYLGPLIFGNTGNLGLPLALFAFGDTGLGLAIAIFAVMAMWSFTFGVWLVADAGSPAKVLKEPVVGATMAGALFLGMGWRPPDWAMNAADLIGQMAIPLMLITLGVAVARLSPGGVGRAVWLSALRTAVCLAAGFGVARLLHLDPTAAAVLVLQVSTPVAVTQYMLAAKYGADAEAVAGLVIVSTLLSVATLPLTLAFLI